MIYSSSKETQNNWIPNFFFLFIQSDEDWEVFCQKFGLKCHTHFAICFWRQPYDGKDDDVFEKDWVQKVSSWKSQVDTHTRFSLFLPFTLSLSLTLSHTLSLSLSHTLSLLLTLSLSLFISLSLFHSLSHSFTLSLSLSLLLFPSLSLLLFHSFPLSLYLCLSLSLSLSLSLTLTLSLSLTNTHTQMTHTALLLKDDRVKISARCIVTLSTEQKS